MSINLVNTVFLALLYLGISWHVLAYLIRQKVQNEVQIYRTCTSSFSLK